MTAGAFELAQRDFLASLLPLLENLFDFFVVSGSGTESSSGKTLMMMDCLTAGAGARTGSGVGAATGAGVTAAGAGAGAGVVTAWGSLLGFAAANASAPDSIRSSSVNRVTFAALRSLEALLLCSGEGLRSVDARAEVDTRVVAEVLRLALRELGRESSDFCCELGKSSGGRV